MRARSFMCLATLLAPLSLIGTGALQAANQTVTFKVPVKLQSIHPDITQPQIHCWLLDKDGKNVRDDKQIVPIPISAGSYEGPINVPVTVTNWEAEQAVGWHCELVLTTKGSPGTWLTYPITQEGSGPRPGQAKSGAPLVHKVEGKFGPVSVTNQPPKQLQPELLKRRP